MKRLIMTTLALALLVGPAFAGNYTVTFDVDEELQIAKMMNLHNARVTAQNVQLAAQGKSTLPLLTKSEYVAMLLKQSFARRWRRTRRRQIRKLTKQQLDDLILKP